VLLELRDGGAGGPEDLFFTLTAASGTSQEQAA